MSVRKIIDIVFNVLLPLAAGAVIYNLPNNVQLRGFARNQLPDGLWAYAFFSCILIIWERKINWMWLIMVFLVFVLFEFFQYVHLINGTGDILDVIIYFLFSCMALLCNPILRKKLYNKPKQPFYAK
jgi:hypothetical protein